MDDHTSEIFCHACDKFHPATTEYWYRDKSKECGFCTPCKIARLAKQNAYDVDHREQEAKRVQEWRETHREEHREYSRMWRQNNGGKQKRDLEKERVRRVMHRAIDRGDMPKAKALFCADCGDNAHDYHHEDYSKPLDVVPLCQICHRKRHRKYA